MHRNGCNAQDHPRIGRRELLQAGTLSLLGTSLADLLRIEADAAAGPTPRKGKAKSVVFIFQSGGPSQHETFDPKPDAPEGIRGEYGSTPNEGAPANHRFGLRVHLPRCPRAGEAGLANKAAQPQN